VKNAGREVEPGGRVDHAKRNAVANIFRRPLENNEMTAMGQKAKNSE